MVRSKAKDGGDSGDGQPCWNFVQYVDAVGPTDASATPPLSLLYGYTVPCPWALHGKRDSMPRQTRSPRSLGLA